MKAAADVRYAFRLLQNGCPKWAVFALLVQRGHRAVHW